MPNVSQENLRKVENYFVEKVQSLGNKRMEATVVEIAEGANVALSTAHKAIKELDQRGVLTVIRPSSRRFPITYIYRGDVEGFVVAKTEGEELEFLRNRVEELERENKALRKSGKSVLQEV